MAHNALEYFANDFHVALLVPFGEMKPMSGVRRPIL